MTADAGMTAVILTGRNLMDFPLTLTRPLVFFDLETTGLDFKYDRIVEIAAIKIFPEGRQETFYRRVNPGMRISSEITAIIGLTNEDVAKCPSFADVFPEVERFFENADLCGYNVMRFDAKVLAEEYKRLGRDFGVEGRHIIDAQTIFHQKEKRDLAAAYKYYCEKDLSAHHTAQADAKATFEIFLAQLNRYDDLPRDVPELHRFCRQDQERFVDGEGKFFWRDGEAVFNFGKYKSQTLKSVASAHPEYLEWLVSPERHFPQEVVDISYEALQGRFPKKST
ncbi:MAG: 3'-5' exonuclease [Elusimicrobia bacterium]|nr:3'-5' exonuclease [Candidatus Obscuribacterium magneticum]